MPTEQHNKNRIAALEALFTAMEAYRKQGRYSPPTPYNAILLFDAGPERDAVMTAWNVAIIASTPPSRFYVYHSTHNFTRNFPWGVVDRDNLSTAVAYFDSESRANDYANILNTRP